MAGTDRVSISASPESLAQLRMLAAHHATTPGVVARALVVYGVEHADEDAVATAIAAEVAAHKAMRAEIGRAGSRTRWDERKQ